MTPLRGAVQGWPYDDALSSISTPDAARAALRADTETSVADPAGLRRLWVRDLYGLLVLVVAIWALVSFVRAAAQAAYLERDWLLECARLAPMTGGPVVDRLVADGWLRTGRGSRAAARVVRLLPSGRRRHQQERARLVDAAGVPPL